MSDANIPNANRPSLVRTTTPPLAQPIAIQQEGSGQPLQALAVPPQAKPPLKQRVAAKISNFQTERAMKDYEELIGGISDKIEKMQTSNYRSKKFAENIQKAYSLLNSEELRGYQNPERLYELLKLCLADVPRQRSEPGKTPQEDCWKIAEKIIAHPNLGEHAQRAAMRLCDSYISCYEHSLDPENALKKACALIMSDILGRHSKQQAAVQFLNVYDKVLRVYEEGGHSLKGCGSLIVDVYKLLVCGVIKDRDTLNEMIPRVQRVACARASQILENQGANNPEIYELHEWVKSGIFDLSLYYVPTTEIRLQLTNYYIRRGDKGKVSDLMDYRSFTQEMGDRALKAMIDEAIDSFRRQSPTREEADRVLHQVTELKFSPSNIKANAELLASFIADFGLEEIAEQHRFYGLIRKEVAVAKTVMRQRLSEEIAASMGEAAPGRFEQGLVAEIMQFLPK